MRVFDQAEGVRIASRRGALFAPGTKLSYSNTNYVLLGMIVEQATGKAIGVELRERIFAPLRLDRTTYPLTSAIQGRHTHGYLGGADVTALSPTLLGAAGAIVSGPADVATFYRALLAGRLLSPAGLSAMRRIDPVATGGVADAGIRGGGWGLGLLRAVPVPHGVGPRLRDAGLHDRGVEQRRRDAPGGRRRERELRPRRARQRRDAQGPRAGVLRDLRRPGAGVRAPARFTAAAPSKPGQPGRCASARLSAGRDEQPGRPETGIAPIRPRSSSWQCRLRT
jgi:hypothetical protein